MNLANYIRDRLPGILGQMTGIVLLFFYLLIIGVGKDDASLILIVWLFGVFIFYGADFWKRKRYFDELEETFGALDEKYLIAEVAQPEYHLEDQIYFDMLRRSNKSEIEKIRDLESQKQEYKEYIETWIHEVKTPLSVLELMCANQKELDSRKVRLLAERLDRDVEMALYYARADQVSKDYRIREISLEHTVREAVKRQKQLLISNGMSVDIDCGDATAFCDEKWIEFILGQMFANAVKYKKGACGHIQVSARKKQEAVLLIVEDEGIGIRQEEIRRIFEKGFTGTNGRTHEHATGIGLYLSRKLCDKLGIAIKAESEEGKFTRFLLTFPKGTFLSKL